MVRLNAKNNSQTALTRDIGPSETSFTVEDPYSLPTPPFRMTIDEEIMEVGAKNDGTKTLSNVIRAQEGTTAQSHSSGSAVRCRFTSGMYDEIKQAHNDLAADHALVKQEVNAPQYSAQISTYDDIITLPENTTKGQVSSIGIKGLTATNLIKNGDFKILGDWLTNSGATLSVNNNILAVTGNGIMNRLSVLQRITFNQNHKYYYRTKARVTNGECTTLRIWGNSGAWITSITSPIANQWYVISDVKEQTLTTSRRDIDIEHIYTDATTANGKVMEVQEFTMINLTETFGAGSEPTKEQCDKIFTNWFDGTKSTVSAIRARSVGKNILGGEKFAQSVIKAVGSSTLAYKTTVDNRNVLALVADNEVHLKTVFDKFKENTQYTVQVYAKKKEELSGGYLSLRYTDGTFILIPPKSTSWEKTVVTSDAGKTIRELQTTYSSYGKTNYYDIDTFQIEEGDTATEYEPYKESVAYITAKDESGNILELQSLPNGTKDEIRVVDKKLICRIGAKTNVASGTLINYADMATGGQFVAYFTDGTQQAGIKGDTLTITATTLTYQLAEPIITPIDAKPITCYENGTVIIEPYIKDKFVVGETLTITLEYPVKAIDKLLKLNTETPEWVEVEGTLSEDGTTITVTEQGTYEVYGEIKPEYSTRAEKTFSVPINLKAQVNSNTDAIKKVNDKIYVDSELFTAMLLQQEMRITLSEQQTADHESRITTLENPTP
jgi:hypothetical protein